MEVAGYAGPALGRDKVYTAFSDGTVGAFSLEDGSEQWPTVDLAAEAEQTSGPDVPRYLDVDTTPVVGRISSGEVVFVASYAGGIFALDAENGTQAWRNDKATGLTDLLLWEQPEHAPRSGSGPAIPARKILLGSSGLSGLWALDPNDGRTLWRRNLPEGGITAPVPFAGALLVGTTRYGLFLFSPLDGAMIDGIATGSGFAMTPGRVRAARVRADERRAAPRRAHPDARRQAQGLTSPRAERSRGVGRARWTSAPPLGYPRCWIA
jgi:outer membrane protein assembly factor BamB